MRLVEDVARTGTEKCIQNCIGYRKGRDSYGDVNVNGRILLHWF
jgi:hypothetical protein